MPGHLVVVGDELETVLAAGCCARLGWRVTLLRRSVDWLGGLSTRGGLAYMDLTPAFLSPVFAQVLRQAGLKRVALEPVAANRVLWAWLQPVRVVSGVSLLQPLWDAHGALAGVTDGTGRHWCADWYWDGTPDGELAAACGVPYSSGMGGVFGPSPHTDTLGVSPVFQLAGVTAQALMDFETRLRESDQAPALLQQVFPHLDAPTRASLLQRAPFCPPESDYLDILNPTMGAFYHHWRYGLDTPYDTAPFWVDGWNIARLANGRLALNGLVTRVPCLREQLALSQEQRPMPAPILEELRALQTFFQTVGQLPQAQVIVPRALYVRQTRLFQAQQPVSGHMLLAGGVAAEQAVGTFSYWLDYRGIHPWLAYPHQQPLPKPQFAVGLGTTFVQAPRLANLVMVNRSAGYSPVSQGACRIVQHQALLAEALSSALTLAYRQNVHPLAIEPQAIRRLWQQLASDLGGHPLPPIQPVNGLQERPDLLSADWLQRDAVVMQQLHQQPH